MLLISIFSFSQNVFKRIISQVIISHDCVVKSYLFTTQPKLFITLGKMVIENILEQEISLKKTDAIIFLRSITFH